MQKPHRRVFKRKDHSLSRRLHGKEQEVVKRALAMGISNTGQLARFTGLSERMVKEICERMNFSARASGRALPFNAVERMLLNGELSVKEIAERTGINCKAVCSSRAKLKQRGFPTVIPRTQLPPMLVARTILRYEVLRQISGKAKYACAIMADYEGSGRNMVKWFTRNPKVFHEAKVFAGGIHWAKAERQLAEWIKAQELFYGKKYVSEK